MMLAQYVHFVHPDPLPEGLLYPIPYHLSESLIVEGGGDNIYKCQSLHTPFCGLG